VPNRHPLTANPPVHGADAPPERPGHIGPLHKLPRVPLRSVLFNWAGLVALWALPYLTLLDHLRPDAARSEILQWSLLAVGTLGLVSLLYSAWRETLDPTWRAKHGFPPRKPRRPHTENTV